HARRAYPRRPNRVPLVRRQGERGDFDGSARPRLGRKRSLSVVRERGARNHWSSIPRGGATGIGSVAPAPRSRSVVSTPRGRGMRYTARDALGHESRHDRVLFRFGGRLRRPTTADARAVPPDYGDRGGSALRVSGPLALPS